MWTEKLWIEKYWEKVQMFDTAFLSFRIGIDCIKHAVKLFVTSPICDKVLEFGYKCNMKSTSYFIQWEFCLWEILMGKEFTPNL